MARAGALGRRTTGSSWAARRPRRSRPRRPRSCRRFPRSSRATGIAPGWARNWPAATKRSTSSTPSPRSWAAPCASTRRRRSSCARWRPSSVRDARRSWCTMPRATACVRSRRAASPPTTSSSYRWMIRTRSPRVSFGSDASWCTIRWCRRPQPASDRPYRGAGLPQRPDLLCLTGRTRFAASASSTSPTAPAAIASRPATASSSRAIASQVGAAIENVRLAERDRQQQRRASRTRAGARPPAAPAAIAVRAVRRGPGGGALHAGRFRWR